MAEARHVRFARELEERDARVAAALGVVRALEADVAEVRAHTEGIASIRAAYPFERERLEGAIAAAREELAAREAELRAAEAVLARAKEGEDRAAAQRVATRAADSESSARKKLARTEAELEALEREAERAEAELPLLQERARDLGRRLAELPHVTAVDVDPADLPALLDWGSRARAALFVAAGGLENEREHVVREAAELGAAVLGEPVVAGSVATVRERIERAAETGGP